MEENKIISPGKFAINYGLIAGLVIVVITIIMYVTGMTLEGKQWPIYLFYLIFPTIIFIAINQYKKSNGVLNLGGAIKIGLVIALVSALVYIIYGLLFNYVIDPEFMDKMLVSAEEKLFENPNMTEEAAQQALKVMKWMMNPIFGSSVWIAASLFFGLVYSLIGGLIMKNDSVN